MAPTSSSRAIQLIHCRPEPMRPPTKNLNGRAMRGRMPPSPARTSEVRANTVRMPASTAGRAASSQACTTSATKSSPGGLCSVTT
jgi:hypothetical protein